jgi:hypothetical protein
MFVAWVVVVSCAAEEGARRKFEEGCFGGAGLEDCAAWRVGGSGTLWITMVGC